MPIVVRELRDELVMGEDELKRKTKRIIETNRDYYNIR